MPFTLVIRDATGNSFVQMLDELSDGVARCVACRRRPCAFHNRPVQITVVGSIARHKQAELHHARSSGSCMWCSSACSCRALRSPSLQSGQACSTPQQPLSCSAPPLLWRVPVRHAAQAPPRSAATSTSTWRSSRARRRKTTTSVQLGSGVAVQPAAAPVQTTSPASRPPVSHAPRRG